MVQVLTSRAAGPADLAALARIYNQGIEERGATFETAPRTAEDLRAWLARPGPVIVVERGGEVVAFASAAPYSPRACYAGVAELSIYVDRAARGQGAGRQAGAAILAALEAAGYWKALGKVFPENRASLALLRALGFDEVGRHRRHARLDGAWRDVVLVEKLLGEAAR